MDSIIVVHCTVQATGIQLQYAADE